MYYSQHMLHKVWLNAVLVFVSARHPSWRRLFYSQHSQNIKNIITPHMQHELGKVISVGDRGQKKLNRNLAINSLFQTFAVRLLKFIDYLYHCFLQITSLSKLRIFLFNAHCAQFVQRMTELQSLNSIGKYRQLVKWTWNFTLEEHHHRWQSMRQT